MRALAAIAELRFRGAAATRLAWLVAGALVLGFACARWTPGIDPEARAAAADATALGACGALALAAALVLGATAFAQDVRTGAAQSLLASPASRAATLFGGVLGHGTFAALLLAASACAALLGLDLGGLGAAHRGAVRGDVPADVLGRDADGFAVLDGTHEEVRGTFRAPAGLATGEVTRVRLAPRRQIETGMREDGVVEVSLHAADRAPVAWTRAAFKAGVAFDVAVPWPDSLHAGDAAAVSVRRPDGAWRLRFGEGSITVGGARERFVGNAMLAVLCAAPLLFLAAAVGALGSARLGAAAALAFVAFLFVLFAGRDIVEDGARYVLVRWDEQTSASHDGAHEQDDGHGHDVHVNRAQAVVAQTALLGLRVVPDPAAFWKFDDVAEGRAVTARDVLASWGAGAVPCLAAAVGGWLLLRRRPVAPS